MTTQHQVHMAMLRRLLSIANLGHSVSTLGQKSRVPWTSRRPHHMIWTNSSLCVSQAIHGVVLAVWRDRTGSDGSSSQGQDMTAPVTHWTVQEL